MLIIDVILGVNIDTFDWIHYLQDNQKNQIVVLDYDYFGEPIFRDGILYLSCLDLKKHLTKSHTVNFYKSMYTYPGMAGKMSSLHKKRTE